MIALDAGGLSDWIILIDIGSLLDGVNAWFFGIQPSVQAALASEVPAAALALGAVVVATGSTFALVWRYQRIEA